MAFTSTKFQRLKNDVKLPGLSQLPGPPSIGVNGLPTKAPVADSPAVILPQNQELTTTQLNATQAAVKTSLQSKIENSAFAKQIGNVVGKVQQTISGILAPLQKVQSTVQGAVAKVQTTVGEVLSPIQDVAEAVEDTKQAVEQTVSNVTTAVGNVVDAGASVANNGTNVVNSLKANSGVSGVGQVQAVGAQVEAVGSAVGSAAESVNKLFGIFKPRGGDGLGPNWTPNKYDPAAIAGKNINSVTGAITDATKAVTNTITTVQNTAQAAVAGVQGAIAGVQTGVQNVITGAQNTVGQTVSQASSIPNTIGNSVIPSSNRVSGGTSVVGSLVNNSGVVNKLDSIPKPSDISAGVTDTTKALNGRLSSISSGSPIPKVPTSTPGARQKVVPVAQRKPLVNPWDVPKKENYPEGRSETVTYNVVDGQTIKTTTVVINNKGNITKTTTRDIVNTPSTVNLSDEEEKFLKSDFEGNIVPEGESQSVSYKTGNRGERVRVITDTRKVGSSITRVSSLDVVDDQGQFLRSYIP